MQHLATVLPPSWTAVSVMTPPGQRCVQGWARRQPARLSATGTLDVGVVAGDLRTHAVWSTASAALAWWQDAAPSMTRRQRPASTSSDTTVTGQFQEEAECGFAPSSAADRQPGSGSHSRGGSGSVRTSRISSMTADAAALAPPHAVLQLRFEASLAPASRLQLLDAHDRTVAVVSSTGSSLCLTTQTGDQAGGSRGSIAEECPPLSAGASFTTPIRPQHRRVFSSVPSFTSNALHQVRSLSADCYLFPEVAGDCSHEGCTTCSPGDNIVPPVWCHFTHTFQGTQRSGCTF